MFRKRDQAALASLRFLSSGRYSAFSVPRLRSVR